MAPPVLVLSNVASDCNVSGTADLAPTGKSGRAILCVSRFLDRAAAVKMVAPNGEIRELIQFDRIARPPTAKICLYENQKICILRSVLHSPEGRCASSRTWSAGCGGRDAVARRAADIADGQVAWS